ncbi:hypothetical protein BX600DRAFT_499485 [Xylariales sp. PMI_506]|nr:hypothetical protein BX600DRAFT_499485 [Xylariales sp. PMI_506]
MASRSDAVLMAVDDTEGQNTGATPPGDNPPSSMTAGPRSQRSEATVRAACVSCRQMKMKCEGGENPPCHRCRKAGRFCRPQTLRRKGTSRMQPSTNSELLSPRMTDDGERSPRNVSTISSDVDWHAAPSEGTTRRVSQSLISRNHRDLDERHPRLGHLAPKGKLPTDLRHLTGFPSHSPPHSSALISIYSGPPVEVVTSFSRCRSMDSRDESVWVNEDSASDFSKVPSLSQCHTQKLLLPLRDLRDMVEMFCDKILPWMPAYSTAEYQDFDALINTQLPLAYCMCYVMAKFLSGGEAIRTILLPDVLQIVRGRQISSGHRLDELSTLKALGILNTYSEITPASRLGTEDHDGEQFSYWPLKYQMEMYALRLSLYKSAQSLKVDLAASMDSDSKNYQLYLFWLQIFVNSHYCSILTGTPPTMRIDSSIRVAPALLNNISQHPQIRLVGEVELCIIWENVRVTILKYVPKTDNAQISLQNPNLGEWWCPPQDSLKDDETEIMLLEVDKAIDAWYERWSEYIGDGRGATLDYLGRFTRFAIATYGVRHLRQSPENLSCLQKDQIRRCSARAVLVLDWPLNLGLVRREGLRYVSDYSWIMILFCCHFILSVCHTFGSIIPNGLESLGKVAQVAQLIMHLAVNSEQKPYIEASNILKRVRSLQTVSDPEPNKVLERELTNNGNSQIRPALSYGQVREDYVDHDLSVSADFWDFSTIFPTGLFTEADGSNFVT